MTLTLTEFRKLGSNRLFQLFEDDPYLVVRLTKHGKDLGVVIVSSQYYEELTSIAGTQDAAIED